MGLSCLHAALALLLSKAVLASASDIDRRQASAKYCNTDFDDVCYSEYTAATSGIVFRVAIPDAPTAPFDTLLQIVAPVSAGWAGLAWGGSMTGNPLTVAWPSGDGATVSSRWATGHVLPAAYAGATYTTLSSSKNATHWALDVLCEGCSQWGARSLDPSGASATTFAWAMSTRAVTRPASNTSSFGYHTDKGRFAYDLGAARLPQDVFKRYVLYLSGGTAASSAAAAATGAPVASSATSVAATTVAAPSSSTTAATVAAGSATTAASSAATAGEETSAAASGSEAADPVMTVVSTIFITVEPATAPTAQATPATPTTEEPSGGDGEPEDAEPGEASSPEETAVPAVTSETEPTPIAVATPTAVTVAVGGRPPFGKKGPWRRPPFHPPRPPFRGVPR